MCSPHYLPGLGCTIPHLPKGRRPQAQLSNVQGRAWQPHPHSGPVSPTSSPPSPPPISPTSSGPRTSPPAGQTAAGGCVAAPRIRAHVPSPSRSPPDLALETFGKSSGSQKMLPLRSQRRFALLHNGDADLRPRPGGFRSSPPLRAAARPPACRPGGAPGSEPPRAGGGDPTRGPSRKDAGHRRPLGDL